MDSIYLNLPESREHVSRMIADLYRVSGATSPMLSDTVANAQRLEDLLCDLGQAEDASQYTTISALNTEFISGQAYMATVDAATMLRELTLHVSELPGAGQDMYRASIEALKDLAIFVQDQKVLLHLERIAGTDQSRLWNYQIGI